MGESIRRSTGMVAVMMGLAGCSSSHSAPLPPSASTTSSASSQPAPRARAQTAQTAVASASADPARQLAEAVAAARACQAPRTVLEGAPPEAKVFNNALTRKDAGNVDRMQGIVDTVFSAREELSCCIDAGTEEMLGDQGLAVLLRWEISAEGVASGVRTIPERSSIGGAVVDACLAAVIGEMSFPESPAGKATTVEFPLRGTTASGETTSESDGAN